MEDGAAGDVVMVVAWTVQPRIMKRIGGKHALANCIQVKYDWENYAFYLVLLGGVIVAIGVVVTSIGENSIERMAALWMLALAGCLFLNVVLLVHVMIACAQVNGKCDWWRQK